MPSFIRPFLYGFLQSVYEPGKRHWLKVKKDYLQGGAMADTADLIVLGAYYGTGNKGAADLAHLLSSDAHACICRVVRVQ